MRVNVNAGWARGCGKAAVRLAACVILITAVSACDGATRSHYAELGESFSKGYQSAADLIKENLNTARRDARRLAVVYYLVNGDDKANLETADIPQSFKRYVCAGVGRNQDLHGGLRVLDAYRKMIADLSAAPSNDLGKLWASIQKLQAPQQPLALSEPDPKAYADCISKSLEDLVPPTGEKIEIPEKEAVGIAAVFSAYEAFSKLVGALEKLAMLALKQVDEAARAKAIKDYVLANQEIVNSIIGMADENGKVTQGILNADALDDPLKRRKKSSLVVPYYAFRKMLRLDRATAGPEILQLEAAIHAALSEFDDLNQRKPPGDVVKVMRGAQAKLVALANGKISAGDAWAEFKAFAAAAKELHDAVKDAVQKAKDARGAVDKL